MNTIAAATFAIAALGLVENALYNAILALDSLQEKLELHKLAVVANEKRKAQAKLNKLADSFKEIEANRLRAIASVNTVAYAARLQYECREAELASAVVEAEFAEQDAHNSFNAEADQRGWSV